MPDRTPFVERAATREIIRLLKIPHVRVFFFSFFSKGAFGFWDQTEFMSLCSGDTAVTERRTIPLWRYIHFPLKHEVCQLTFIIPCPPAATEPAARLFVSQTIRTGMSHLVLSRWRHQDFKRLLLNDVRFPADEERDFIRRPSSLPP